MRIFTFLALMAAAAIPMSAAGVQASGIGAADLQRGPKPLSVDGFSPKVLLNQSLSSDILVSNIPAPSGDDQPIYDPEGTKSEYIRSGVGFGRDMIGSVYQISSEGAISHVVMDEDGKTVYISNIFSQAAPAGYVEGTLADGKVTITLPQVVDFGYDSGEEVPFYAAVMEYDPSGKTFVVAEDQTFVFNVGEDGVWTPENRNAMIGWVVYFKPDNLPADYYWQGIGDVFTSFSEWTKTPVEAPEDLEFGPWALVCNGEVQQAEVAVKDDKVYMKNFLGFNFVGLENSVVTGTIADGKVTFDDKQYLGVDEWLMTTIYFNGGTPVRDPEIGLVVGFEGSDFVAEFSPTLIKGENSFFITRTPNSADFEVFYETPFFAKTDPEAPVANPSAPYALRLDDGTADNPDDPTPYLDFSIPLYDVNYNTIDPTFLYWQLMVDDNEHPYVFTPELYGVEEEMENVPYEYTSDDWSIVAFGEVHDVDIKFTDYKRIGVRCVYIEDDTKLYSETTWLDTSSVEVNPESPAVATMWFDLQGNRLTSPRAGLLIRADRRADGSVKYTKTMHR